MTDQTALLRQLRQALRRNDDAAALTILGQLTMLARAEGDHAALARHHGTSAHIYHQQGQLDAALEHLALALDSARADGDLALQSGLLGSMGNLLREASRCDEAIQYLENALALAVDVGDERGRGMWLSNLALVYDDLRQFASAIPLHEQSVHVARGLRDLRGLAARLGYLARSCSAFGDHPGALIHLQEAVMIDRDLGDQAALAARLAEIGNLYVSLAQRTATRPGLSYCYRRAVEHYRQSLTAAYEAGDAYMQADLLRTIGEVLLALDEPDQAINHLDAAYQMFSSLGVDAPLAALQTALGHARAARQVRAV